MSASNPNALLPKSDAALSISEPDSGSEPSSSFVSSVAKKSSDGGRCPAISGPRTPNQGDYLPLQSSSTSDFECTINTAVSEHADARRIRIEHN